MTHTECRLTCQAVTPTPVTGRRLPGARPHWGNAKPSTRSDVGAPSLGPVPGQRGTTAPTQPQVTPFRDWGIDNCEQHPLASAGKAHPSLVLLTVGSAPLMVVLDEQLDTTTTHTRRSLRRDMNPLS